MHQVVFELWDSGIVKPILAIYACSIDKLNPARNVIDVHAQSLVASLRFAGACKQSALRAILKVCESENSQRLPETMYARSGRRAYRKSVAGLSCQVKGGEVR